MAHKMTNEKVFRNAVVLVAMMAIAGAVGCGKDPVQPPLPPPPPDDVGYDAEPDGWENNPWNNTPDTGFPPGCEPNVDLGVLSAPTNRAINDAIEEHEGTVTSCYSGTEETGHWLLSFTIENLAIVTLDVLSPIGDEPYYELHLENCSQPSLVCKAQDPRHAFIAEPGRYFLRVEKPWRVNELRFDVMIELEELVCYPGELLCTEGDVEVCNQGRRWREIGSCATECHDESSCAGDVCDDAITVDLVPTGPNRKVTFTGDRHAFTHHWDADGRQGCYLFKDELEEGDDDIGLATSNGELFFRVPGLSSGQRLSVEAVTFGGNYGFYVLSDCGAESCLGAASADNDFRRRLEWVVPANGDYIVVIESLGADNREFEFEFELSNN